MTAPLPHRRHRRLTRSALVGGLVGGLVACGLVLTGCGGGEHHEVRAVPEAPATADESVARKISDATFRAGEPIPAPTGRPVLTVTGKIGTGNRMVGTSPTLTLDRFLLDRLGVLQVNAYEPWKKKRMDFRGVWLADVLKAAQVDATRHGVHITALDDYQVDLTAAEVAAGGIFLATRAGDGSAIPVADGGPTRIVFLDGVASGSNQDQWIWSLKTIDVR